MPTFDADPRTLLLILAAHAAATWFMAGLCWCVQIVHYPLLLRIARESPRMLSDVARQHASHITWIVGPAMLIEAASAAVMITIPAVDQPMALIGLAGLVLVWISTFAVQVPLHSRLQRAGPDAPEAARLLVLTNWVRTLTWTFRGVIALAIAIPLISWGASPQ
jgi:hypothetical protein